MRERRERRTEAKAATYIPLPAVAAALGPCPRHGDTWTTSTGCYRCKANITRSPDGDFGRIHSSIWVCWLDSKHGLVQYIPGPLFGMISYQALD